jgi:hypothetical protein
MMLEQLKHLLVALLLLLLVATVCETLDPGKEKEQMRHGKSKFVVPTLFPLSAPANIRQVCCLTLFVHYPSICLMIFGVPHCLSTL